LGSHTKNKKNKKNTYKKILKRNPKNNRGEKGCWNTHKMARNWLRKFKNTRIEIL